MNKGFWAMLVLGGLLLATGVWMLSTALASTSWPVVEGTVVSSNVASRYVNSRQTGSRKLEYYIRVTYRYEVNGISHQSQRHSLGMGNTFEDGFYDKAEAQAWLAQSPYQRNQAIKVHVDPNDPTNTVISAGIGFATWIPLILGLVFTGFAVLLKWINENPEKFQTKPKQPPPTVSE